MELRDNARGDERTGLGNALNLEQKRKEGSRMSLEFLA